MYDRGRHAQEIERSENIAAGLPPEGTASAPTAPEPARGSQGNFREPNLETPVEVQEEKRSSRSPSPSVPRAWWKPLRGVTTTVIKKVHRLIKPIKRTHKEVIINAESLETRVAVLEEGKPGGIHHRTDHGRASGRQHFQGQAAQFAG